MIYLQKYGISTTLAAKIYKQYGQKVYHILEENPYQIADDVQGVGFKTADEIAMRIGIHTDSDYRIRSGIFYALLQGVAEGHIYLPEEILLRRTAALLEVEISDIQKYLMDLSIEKKIVLKQTEQGIRVYPSNYYYMELNTAKMLHDLNIHADIDVAYVSNRLQLLEQDAELSLDEMQRQAVIEAAKHGILVLTGGPGTGKTTTINAMIQYFGSQGLDILLAAPTGRAAKRMTEATGYEAQTIHRLLEVSGNPEDGDGRSGFARNEENPLETDFARNEENPLETDILIIDEVSMVDLPLMHALLRAIIPGTRLIFVGDGNQLPSVGPGSVLKDLLRSECFPTVCLTKIFRQATESDIVMNAHKINRGEPVVLDNKSRDFFFLKRQDANTMHKINRGEPVVLDNKSRDFFFLKRQDANTIISVVITLLQKKLPKYVDAETYDIQVLTPMRKGLLGVERLNRILQEYLNPPNQKKTEKEYGDKLFRETYDIQVLTPMRKGLLGVERLNRILQEYLNPPNQKKTEKEYGDKLFREGDKVMQIKNNYQLEWEIATKYGLVVDKGVGIFNGDMGIITNINTYNETLEVEYDEKRKVTYPFQLLDELELAYAITIHKAQGSEYPAVVIPLLPGPRQLFHRNLLYTAVTRAKKCVTLVGSEDTFYEMIQNAHEQNRYTSLSERIQEFM